MIWIVYFSLVAAGIIYAASRLSIYADALAEKLNLSRSWVGLLLVSLVTTLPEGATTVSSITQVDSPNLALGNNFGSILFNITIIAICDLAFRRARLFQKANRRNMLPAAFSMIMVVFVLISLCFPVPVDVAGLRFGAGSPLLFVLYLSLFFCLRRFGSDQSATPDAPRPTRGDISTRRVLLGFSISAVAVVGCGLGLAVTGKNLAVVLGLTDSFVGMLFMAFATSLPELIVGITAVRIGAYDLMLGNVMGANMLNVLVIGIADLVYVKDVLHVPGNLGRENLFAGLMSLIATSIVMLALIRAPRARIRLVTPYSVLILLVYLGTVATMFFGKGLFMP